jgi:hypothetical protein
MRHITLRLCLSLFGWLIQRAETAAADSAPR